MKNLAICAFTFVLLFSSIKEGYAQCDKNEVLVPVVYEFSNSQFRVEWIYATLEPMLIINNKMHRPLQKSLTNAGLGMSFCVAEREVPSPNIRFFLKVGPRQLSISARPVKKKAMPTIEFRHQADPDWVVIKHAAWLVNSEGFPRIDIEVYNFANITHPGGDIALHFSNSESWCQSVPRFVEVPISVSFSKKSIKLASGDPQNSELIQRKSELVYGPCGELGFDAYIGSLGSLPANDVLRVRYVFSKKIPTAEGPVKDIFSLPLRWLLVSGDRIFPARVKIESK